MEIFQAIVDRSIWAFKVRTFFFNFAKRSKHLKIIVPAGRDSFENGT